MERFVYFTRICSTTVTDEGNKIRLNNVEPISCSPKSLVYNIMMFLY